MVLTNFSRVLGKSLETSLYSKKNPKNVIHFVRAFGKVHKDVCAGSENIQTVEDVKNNLRKIMGVERGYHPILKSRGHLLDMLPATQDELPPRTIKDSYDQALIPLSKDFALQDKYVNFTGKVRFGRLMEDLDLFAVHTVFKHLLYPKQQPGAVTPAVVVTIMVDEIKITDIIPSPYEDIRISGHVSWVGTSSIEVEVWLEQCIYGRWAEIIRGIFLMAVRNSTMTKSAFINKLVIAATDDDKNIALAAEQRIKKRGIDMTSSLLKTPPTPEEQQLMHDMFINSSDLNDITLNRRLLPTNGVWLKNTIFSTVIFCHPEDRNLHNKIFGGFLMRNSLEVAFMSAFVFSKQRPRLRHSSGIIFHHPVDVGTLVRMTGQVVYTEKNFMQVTVYATLVDPVFGKSKTTNVFNYTYESSNYVNTVIPGSYSEAMMFIDGRRNFQNSISKGVYF